MAHTPFTVIIQYATYLTYCRWTIWSEWPACFMPTICSASHLFVDVVFQTEALLILHSILLWEAVRTNFLSWVYEDTCWTFSDIVFRVRGSLTGKHRMIVAQHNVRFIHYSCECVFIWLSLLDLLKHTQCTQDKWSLLSLFYWRFIFFSCSS